MTYPEAESNRLKNAIRRPTDCTDGSDLNGLMPFLHWLDGQLTQGIAALPVDGVTIRDTPYGELVQPSPETLKQLFVREAGVSPFQTQNLIPVESIPVREQSVLAWLQQAFELSAVDLVILAIALAPELDRRYEKLYAYLQDDMRCKRPTVNLVLNLLCSSASEKLEYRSHFATDAPLVQHGLLHLVAEGNASRVTLLAQELHLDDQVVNLLLNQSGLDQQLKSFCSLSQPVNQTIFPREQALLRLVTDYWQTERPLRLYFQGADPSEKRRVAEAIAAALQVPLLITDVSRLLEQPSSFDGTLKRILREAQFRAALLYLDDLNWVQEHRDVCRSLGSAISNYSGIVLLAGTRPYAPLVDGRLGVLTISFALPDAAHRQELWRSALSHYSIEIDELNLQGLSARFQLTANQIEDAVNTAWNTVYLRTLETAGNEPMLAAALIPSLFSAARSQTGHDLTMLARKIEPKQGWKDIVLPANQTLLLQELCQEAKYQTLVWESWGFAQKLSLGKGLNVLFSGPPGTGKTMAAEVIAHELGLDLYQIDLSQMVSKYIGETEKNLNRVFTAAANSNAILLFDEADALFGKRSEVRDAHDRYANIETSYLLQKMEEYEGIAILTTNFRSNLDEAFVRRLRYIIEFELPGARERQQIWERIWPEHLPRDPDLDLEFMASQFELPGANIRNIALRAAFLAAGNQQPVGMVHLITALQREYQKMGKMLMMEQLGPYARLL